MSRNSVDCVSGILIDKGRVLVERRRSDDAGDPGLVVLPGGHVEPGEPLKHAIAREMGEELGITPNRMIPVSVAYHVASDGERQRVHYFHVRDWTGKIESKEAELVYWESDPGNLSFSSERRLVLKIVRNTWKENSPAA